MKRYDIIPKMGRGKQLFVKEVETPEGKYVRYKDVCKLIDMFKRYSYIHVDQTFEEIFDSIEAMKKENC